MNIRPYVHLVLIAGVALGVAFNRKLPPPDSPKTPQALIHRLDDAGMRFYVVPNDAGGDLSSGVYLCTKRQSDFDAVRGLPRIPSELSKWKGVVLVENMSTEPWPVRKLDSVNVAELQLFGDPELIERIEAAVH